MKPTPDSGESLSTAYGWVRPSKKDSTPNIAGSRPSKKDSTSSIAGARTGFADGIRVRAARSGGRPFKPSVSAAFSTGLAALGLATSSKDAPVEKDRAVNSAPCIAGIPFGLGPGWRALRQANGIEGPSSSAGWSGRWFNTLVVQIFNRLCPGNPSSTLGPRLESASLNKAPRRSGPGPLALYMPPRFALPWVV